MIAVITGFLRSAGFLWASLVFPGIWLSQALAQTIHRSLWKQRDNLFVRRPFHAWLLRCFESTKTFRLLFSWETLLLGYAVFLATVRNPIQHKVHSFQTCEQFLLSFHVSWQVGCSEWVRTIWTWCEDLYFESRFLSLIFPQPVWHILPSHPLLISLNFSVSQFLLCLCLFLPVAGRIVVTGVWWQSLLMHHFFICHWLVWLRIWIWMIDWKALWV